MAVRVLLSGKQEDNPTIVHPASKMTSVVAVGKSGVAQGGLPEGSESIFSDPSENFPLQRKKA